DGILDFHMTGVQTCALPISIGSEYGSQLNSRSPASTSWPSSMARVAPYGTASLLRTAPSGVSITISPSRLVTIRSPDGVSTNERSEERRVEKDCRSR